MFFQRDSFRVMESGLNAAWLQQQIHNQNLSNVETPGYKAKNATFEDVFAAARDGGRRYQATVFTRDDLTMRPDGNNVDAEVESMELYKAYVQYSMLLDKVSSQFSNYSYILNNAFK